MENNFLVLLDSHTNSKVLYPLTKTRAIGSVPFFGKYRLIDITLTAIKNSGCQNVGIFPNNNVRSLVDHVKSGRTWNLEKKKDGITIFQPDDKSLLDEGITYSILEKNIKFLECSTQEYVVLGHTHTVHNMDLKEIVDFHIKSNMQYTKVVYQGKDTGFYVVNKSTLIKNVSNSVYTFEHCINDSISNSSSVCTYSFDGYFKEINNIKSYLDVSFEFLDTIKTLDNVLPNIISKDTLQKPSKYFDGSKVINSVVSDSCIIKGEVSDSIIFKSNCINQNTLIEKTIMFNGCEIGAGVTISNALIDKNVVIKDGVKIISMGNNPIYIKKGSVISEDCIM